MVKCERCSSRVITGHFFLRHLTNNMHDDFPTKRKTPWNVGPINVIFHVS